MINYRKIAAVLAGITMLGSTVALAAAANYPAPFVSGGSSDVAIVYGSTAANTDLVAVADINAQLQQKLAEQTAVSGSSSASVSVTGEVAPLFTGATKILLNDSLNKAVTSLSASDLPTILAKQSFSGNVDTTYSQYLTIGTNPKLTYGKIPTSSDSPQFGLSLGTNPANQPIYTASVNFNKKVNLSNSDSIGQDLTLFGQKFTIASATDGSNLVLLKSAQKVTLDNTSPSTKVTVAGVDYTVELVSVNSGGDKATVKVTDASGNSDSKDVLVSSSKKIQGLTVAITSASANNFKYSASILVGSQKVTISEGSVTVGDDSTSVDGVTATFNGGNPAALNTLSLNVSAPNSDSAALRAGDTFVDPVFGSFKIEFPTLSAPENSSSREVISIDTSGDDQLSFTATVAGQTKPIQFIENSTSISSGVLTLSADTDGNNITVMENQPLHKNSYVVVGNEDSGRLVKLTKIRNDSSSTTQAEFTDAYTGEVYTTSFGADPTSGTVTIGQKQYSVKLAVAPQSAAESSRNLTLGYPDSSGAGSAIVYPTIQTSKGAKLMLYKPMTITMDNWDGAGNDLATLQIPNGANAYTSTTVANAIGLATQNNFTITGAGTGTLVTGVNATTVSLTIGRMAYNLVGSSTVNQSTLYLVSGGAAVTTPALVLIEGKDDASNYNALVVTPQISSSKIGVANVVGTEETIGTRSALPLPGNTDVTKQADLYGSIVTVDKSSTNQYTATISYPAQQVYAQIYAAANSAAIETSGGSSGATGVKSLGSVAVSDSEVTSVSAKNLIVVGGNCVNSVAATLLGISSATCGADFETKAGVVGGQFLIQTFASPFASGKIATLVAGRYAADRF